MPQKNALSLKDSAFFMSELFMNHSFFYQFMINIDNTLNPAAAR